MTHLKIEKLTVTINSKPILKDLSFELNTDERILILGASGCGKSTLLLSLMGITQRFDNAQVSGNIFIRDRSIQEMKADEISKILGLVFQNPESQFCSLYPEDEVAFGLENLCVDPEQMDPIINKSLQIVGFPNNKYKNAINTLSGGEQQRLALAAIFAQGAELFLLDEPTANLDPTGRRQIVASAKTAAKAGKGLLVVEHNLEHWLPFLNRLIILDNDGTILCDGNPREIFEKLGPLLNEKGIWRPQSIRLYDQLIRLGHNFSKVPLNSRELANETIPETALITAFQRLRHNPKMAASSGHVILNTKDLSVAYEKNKPIFYHVNLTIMTGDFWALVGANGSGKSTLAKTLIGLIEPACGAVILEGKNIMEMKLKDIFNRIGYVFQNPEHQFVADTVWSEIAYSVEQLDIDENSKKQHIHALLKEFDLLDFLSNNPFSLSGGQKRKLSVATMLVGNQKLLILDEPTFGQDQKNAYALMDKLSELNRKGITIFMITHDLDLVAEYANKTAVLYDGTLVFSGQTHDLWQQKRLIAQSGLELPFKIKVISRDDEEHYVENQ
ncbi:MAG TPA: cobalt ABC transporter [Firmicutes bacterium]|jgi:energy-coupling factor transport system ATP-binding protein|nr:cobalt ABC transporter [Bacillota bacterium]